MKVKTTLKPKGSSYGAFEDGALIAQSLKSAMRDIYVYNWNSMAPDIKEALELIQRRIARIINDDENHIDSCRDIQKYALLIEKRIQADIENVNNAIKEVAKK